MPTYNKLIRDRILEIIEKDNLAYNARVLEPEEHLTEIKKKLYEEVKEFDETTNNRVYHDLKFLKEANDDATSRLFIAQCN